MSFSHAFIASRTVAVILAAVAVVHVLQAVFGFSAELTFTIAFVLGVGFDMVARRLGEHFARGTD